jgi:hypothetical protein
MDGQKLKQDILTIKTRLDNVEKDLQNQIKELTEKEEILNKVDEKANELMKNEKQLITFNICGKKFMTRQSTLLKTRDTLFYKMILSDWFNPNEEIFFDADPKSFEIILDYLRTKKINLKNLNNFDYKKLRKEVVYFEIGELNDMMSDDSLSIELESFEYNGPYTSGGSLVGTNKIDDLNERSMMKGICATSPGWILITINREILLESLDIGGYRGNPSYWACDNGSGASIKVSTDKTNWINVGTIPTGYGTSIKNVKFTSVRAKYLKFDHTSYLGIGFLKLNSN